MEAKEIKSQMMKLWKDTFHDSDDYISMVFDNYFSAEIVEYEERDGEIVAAMMAVPYHFGYKSRFRSCGEKYTLRDSDSSSMNLQNGFAGICDSLSVDVCDCNYIDSDSNESVVCENHSVNMDCYNGDDFATASDDSKDCGGGHTEEGEDLQGYVNGLYLCGLATKPEYRGEGIMSQLIERISVKASRMGYAFTFLIPASDSLRLYYSDRGYLDSFPYYKLNYVAEHKFCDSIINISSDIQVSSVDNYSNSSSDNENCSVDKFLLSYSKDSNTTYVSIKYILSCVLQICGFYESRKVSNVLHLISDNIIKYVLDRLSLLLSYAENECSLNGGMKLLHSANDYLMIIKDCLDSCGDIIIGILDNRLCVSVDCMSDLIACENSNDLNYIIQNIKNNPKNLESDYKNKCSLSDCDIWNEIVSSYFKDITDISSKSDFDNIIETYSNIVGCLLRGDIIIDSAAFLYGDSDDGSVIIKDIIFKSTDQFNSLMTSVQKLKPGRGIRLFAPASMASGLDKKLPKADFYGMLRPANVVEILKMLCLCVDIPEFSTLVSFDINQFDELIEELSAICVHDSSIKINIGSSGSGCEWQYDNFIKASDGINCVSREVKNMLTQAGVCSIYISLYIRPGYLVMKITDIDKVIVVSSPEVDVDFNSIDFCNLLNTSEGSSKVAISLHDLFTFLFSRVKSKQGIDRFIDIPALTTGISLMLD